MVVSAGVPSFFAPHFLPFFWFRPKAGPKYPRSYFCFFIWQLSEVWRVRLHVKM
jgi:hypothetical protein